MRCLLVSYAELDVNSTDHAAAFARGLSALGWTAYLAALTLKPQYGFRFFLCGADGSRTGIFSVDHLEPMDVVHVWSPRYAIWRFLELHADLIGCALILHLEDDEDEVLRMSCGSIPNVDSWLGRARLRYMKPGNWAHPILARCLVASADGVTVLNPNLSDQIPALTPCLHVVPPLEPLDPIAEEMAIECGVEEMIVYAGGVHQAVAGDFLALSRAMGLLVKKNRPVRFVRCGPPTNQRRLLSMCADVARKFEDLGFISPGELRSLLASASVLVQPGAPNRFNRRRFPSKLPAYLASGTPVVMPACYEWLGVKHGEHVVMFGKGDAEDIAYAIETVLDDPEGSSKMGIRAAEFARALFNPARCCSALDEFYRKVLERPPTVPWRHVRQPRIELPSLLSESHLPVANLSRKTLTRFIVEERRRAAHAEVPTR